MVLRKAASNRWALEPLLRLDNCVGTGHETGRGWPMDQGLVTGVVHVGSRDSS